MIAAILVALALLLGCVTASQAHQINLSNARIEVGPNHSVAVEVAVKGSDAGRAAGTEVFDARSGLVRADALADAAAPIAAYMTAHAVVLGENGTPCRPGPATVSADEDGVVVHIVWDCADVAGPLVYRSTVLTDIEPTARQIVLIGGSGQSLLSADETDVVLTERVETGLATVVLRYTSAGIEHIFVGYDHIAFLTAIVLWARRLLPVVKIVTAFTVAHSLTLSLAALDVIRIPSAIVEPAIAASIVCVAIENFFSRDVENRWRITFAFGLIHGFGFAGALQEFGVPKNALIPALASFNVGVEIGQIAIVSLVLPVLLALDRLLAAPGTPRAAPMVYAASGIICVLGGYWFLMRTVVV